MIERNGTYIKILANVSSIDMVDDFPEGEKLLKGVVGTWEIALSFLGEVRFEKVCDGRVWRELTGCVCFRRRGKKTRVRIEMDGRTKPLVPEFTIRSAMKDQLEQMVSALRERLEQA